MRNLLICILVCLAQLASAQPAPHSAMRSMKEVTDLAQQSLEVFSQVANDGNYRSLGFDSLAEIRSARAEPAIPVYMVGLDTLRRYARGSDPVALLMPLDKAIVPLSVQGQVKSSVSVEMRDGRWSVESYGAPNLARALARARVAVANAAQGAAPFAVHVPALNSYFLGHREGTRLMLTTVIDDPNLKVPAGRTLPAEDVFATLAPIAQAHNGLPSN